MLSCWRIRRNLTAWADGELNQSTRHWLQAHLQGCADCARQAQQTEAFVRWQMDVLPAATTIPPVEVNRLWQSLVRARAQQEAARPGVVWGWLRPAVLATAVVFLCLFTFVGVRKGPEVMLVPLGIKSPPVAVSQSPALFKDYPVIEKLDMLEHFDTVDSIPLDDEEASENS